MVNIRVMAVIAVLAAVPALATAGRIVWPVSGSVTSSYGNRSGGFHHGIDIGVNSGTILGAPGFGTVNSYFYDSCAGNMHLTNYGNGWQTRFLHCSGSIVGPGNAVNRNQDIARSGNSGSCTTGPHLHFEVRRDGVSQNIPGSPGNWVTRGSQITVNYNGLNDMVQGAILTKYNSVGGYNSVLGLPNTWEITCPDGVGKFNHFQGGSIYWTPSTGAHIIMGLIRSKWASVGWETGDLGYPTTDEFTCPDGVGKFNHFQGGSIYWTSATGAHIVGGAIKTRWGALGWETGDLGYPETDELICPDNVGRYNHFQGGSIYWSPSTGAHEIFGAIRSHWASLGWEQSTLGYPTSGEYTVTEGRRSDFQNGTITWHSATNTVTVP